MKSDTRRVDLRSVHRLLIRFAVALSVVLIIYGLGMYFGRHDRGAIGLAIFGAVATVGWVMYLRWFNRKTRGT